MLRKTLFIFFLILNILNIQDKAIAVTAETYQSYVANNSITGINLDGNLNNIRNVLNGGIDNGNVDTDNGYRLYERLSVLPGAGQQGRVVFYTVENSLNFDTGSEWIKAITITSPAQGDLVYYSGTAWVRLSPGTSGQFLKTQGAGANPTWASTTENTKQFFTSSGTFTTPTGVSIVYITEVGGGAGGGSGGTSGGGGGGSGAYIMKFPVVVTAGIGYTVTIGAAGTGGAGSGQNGTAGTASSFAGNSITISANGGGAGNGDVGGNTGGAGGTTSSTINPLTIAGRTGANNSTVNGGDGAGSLGGKGGVGATSADTAGGNASAYGAGGGGGRGAANGGDGVAGFVLVEWENS